MAYASISKPSLHFNTTLYTGNGSTLNVTGMDFQPDFSWLKCRGIAYHHALFDVVRGTGKRIRSNDTIAEQTATTEGVTAFNSDGYTVVQGSTYEYNNNNVDYASWNWKAGNSAGSSNTDGSINTTSTSVNTTAGFSISTYTGNATAGATIGHGLGVIPKMIIAKRLNGSTNWAVYHAGLGSASKYLQLNTTAAETTDNAVWDGATPTSSVFYVGSSSLVNASGGTYVAYCFAEKKGYSKFGTYTGNGNADGTFIYTGFKPAFIMQKRTDSTSNWHIFDVKRDTYNAMNKYLLPNDTGTESTAGSWDFLSNGFKVRSADNWQNQSGGTYIFMAFAEEPLVANVGSSIPATAR